MCLLVADGLQRVFEAPQEDIGVEQVLLRVSTQSAIMAQPVERRSQVAAAQRPFRAAADKLQRLRDKFDLTDTAGTELDIVGQLTLLHLDLDQRFHVAKRFEDAVVEVSAVDERLDHG